MTSAVVSKNVPSRERSARSHAGGTRSLLTLSSIGVPHSGQFEAAGRPLSVYPQRSHSKSLSAGTIGATRVMDQWYTSARPVVRDTPTCPPRVTSAQRQLVVEDVCHGWPATRDQRGGGSASRD